MLYLFAKKKHCVHNRGVCLIDRLPEISQLQVLIEKFPTSPEEREKERNKLYTK
jgi:hypothetical protein